MEGSTNNTSGTGVGIGVEVRRIAGSGLAVWAGAMVSGAVWIASGVATGADAHPERLIVSNRMTRIERYIDISIERRYAIYTLL
jgi:hypothetical protein